MKKIGLIATIASAGILSASSSVYAAGFAIKETSAALVGQAFAGSAAVVGDLTTMYNNPASMAYLNKHEVALSGSYIIPSTKFKEGGGSTGATGGNGGNGAKQAVVPALYALWNVKPNFKFGVGFTSPFGLTTEYDASWKGRYHAIKSSLKTMNINPAVAYKVSDSLSLGVGLSFQYADVEIIRNIKQSIGDGYSKITGNSWGGGFNLGALYEPWKGTRFGLAYRSSINNGLSGEAEHRNINPLLAGVFPAKVKVNADFTTPDTVTLSAVHDINSQWKVMADISLTRWNHFNMLTVKRDDTGAVLGTAERQAWKNSWFYALGLNYQFNPSWLLRLGVAYDQSPVIDEYRSPRLPDADRTWISAGLDYTMTESLTARLTYAHIFAKDSKVNLTTGNTNPLLGTSTLQGKFQSHVDIVGLQFNWKF